MWRKIMQSTYRRKSQRTVLQAAERAPIQRYGDILGVLARMWSGIEGNLDVWVEVIHENGGAQKIQPQLPPNLDRELDYLKAAIKSGFVPNEDVDEARRLVQEIHSVKMFRHTLIHGYLVEISDDGRVLVEHSQVRGAARIRRRSTYSLTQQMRHLERTHKLESDLWTFLNSSHVNVE